MLLHGHQLPKKPAMIRITHSSLGSRLVVEGHLSGRAVNELLESCATVSAGGTVLDMSGVMFADRFAAVTLCKLSEAGFALEGCPGFINELLRETRHRSARVDSDEIRFIHDLRTGDSEAFELLVRRYGGRMLAAARRIVRDESNARDAVQEAFLSVFRSIGNFAEEAALGTWLHRIVVNAALMQIRSRRRRCEEPIEQLLPRFDESGDWANEACPANPVEELHESRERLAFVRKSLDKLPERYRTVLILRDIEDLDTGHVARMLNITPTAVKVRLHRARLALKTLVERETRIASVAST